MEVSSHRIVYKALLVLRLVASVVSEHSFFEPLALHRVGTRLLSGFTELVIQEWVSMEHLFLLSALDLLHFGKLL